MRRSCPASARSTATRSSRAMRSSKGHYVLLDPEEIESVKLESRKTLDLVQFVDDDGIDADVFRQALLCRPGGRPRRGSLCRPARRVEGREEGRRRPARDARPGICRRAEAVRPRPAARDAALRRRGPQVGGLLPRHRRPQARSRPARHGLDADRAQSRRVRPEGIPQPLRRRAARADREEAEGQGREDHRGSGRRRGAAQGLERHRPDGRAQEEPRRREEAARRPRRLPAKKAAAPRRNRHASART